MRKRREPADLAAQRPAGIGEFVTSAQPRGRNSFGVEKFLRRLAAPVDASQQSAEWDASAVLCAEAVTGGQLKDHTRGEIS